MPKVIPLLPLVVFASGCFLMKVYRDQYHHVSEQHDSKGRLISRTVTGYDCCLGVYENIFEFDTAGRMLREYGFENGAKYSNFFSYDDSGRLILAEYYGRYNTDDTTRIFDRGNSYLTTVNKHAYYSDGKESSSFVLEFSRDIPGDTFSYSHVEYDTAGVKTKAITRFANCACFISGNDSCTVYIQLKDELLQTVDTVRIKKDLITNCGECEDR